MISNEKIKLLNIHLMPIGVEVEIIKDYEAQAYPSTMNPEQEKVLRWLARTLKVEHHILLGRMNHSSLFGPYHEITMPHIVE